MFGEKAVKQLLNSYFSIFSSENFSKYSKQVGCSVYLLPEDYYDHGENIRTLGKLKSMISTDSMYYIPDECDYIEFKHVPIETLESIAKIKTDIEKIKVDLGYDSLEDKSREQINMEMQTWKISVVTFSDNFSDVSKKLEKFGRDAQNIKKAITDMYYRTIMTFNTFKYKYKLETISLVLNEKTFCLELKDSKFPKFEFDTKIIFELDL